MIKREVSIKYVVICDECGKKLGDVEVLDNNYFPSKTEIHNQFAMFHTPEGKYICQSCFTKNISKYCIMNSASSVDKCDKL